MSDRALERVQVEIKATSCGIPRYMHEGIEKYVIDRRRSGDFLMAVFANDLVAAAGRADHTNMHLLRHYALYLYNHAPPDSWGSWDKVDAWIEARKTSTTEGTA